MLVEGRSGMERHRLVDYNFPHIESEADLKRLAIGGLKIAKEVKRGFSDEQKANLLFGNNVLTLGYVINLFGGREGCQGKRIIVVADGDVTPPFYKSFTGTQSRIMAGIGVEKVLLVDPIAKSENYRGFNNLEVAACKVEDLLKPTEKFDIIISSQFLGGPDWQESIIKDPYFGVRLLQSMADISDVQVHLGARDEIDLSVLSKDKLDQVGLSTVYNFNVSRNLGNQFNQLNDLIVVDNRKIR